MRMLISDDHPIVVMATSMLLEANGHEIVATTESARSVAELVREHQPDVCIIDLLYGEAEDCVEALAAISEVADQTRVVVVSGSLDGTQREAALAAGAAGVVSKSAPSSDLLAIVEGRDEVRVSQRAAERDDRRYHLTSREREVLQSLIDGDCTARMADRLGMRSATARSHVQNLMLKLGVHTRAAAVARGISEGLCPVSS